MITMKAKTRARIEELLRDFPDRPAALIPALFIIQEEENHLTKDNLDQLAAIICMPKSTIYETASFYSLFSFEPQGKHVIRLCRNICCFLRGSDQVLSYLQEKLGISAGETTADGLFSLQVVECIAACERSPAMMINDKTYGPLTEGEIDRILKAYR